MNETVTISVKDRKARLRKARVAQVKEFIGQMFHTLSAKVGLVILTVMVLACLFAPLIAPYGVDEMDLSAMLQAPSLQHICGTDNLGRDIFTRLLYGGQYSLAMGICATLFSNALGIILGCIAGYFSGKTEAVIMRLMDIWSALPGTLMCIIISQVLGSGFFNTMLALSIGGIPAACRMTRAMILSERTKEYLEAAQSINCSNVKIMFKHLLPNVIQPTIVQITMGIGGTISASAGLSYIGLGVRPPTPEWGAMLSMGSTYIMYKPYLLLWPGVAIALTVYGLNLVGDGLRDALDPKLRS